MLHAASHPLRGGLTDKEFREKVCAQLGSVKNIVKVFLEAIACEHEIGIGESFSCLDVESARGATRRFCSILEPDFNQPRVRSAFACRPATVEPLAKMLRSTAALSAHPAAKLFVFTNISFFVAAGRRPRKGDRFRSADLPSAYQDRCGGPL